MHACFVTIYLMMYDMHLVTWGSIPHIWMWYAWSIMNDQYMWWVNGCVYQWNLDFEVETTRRELDLKWRSPDKYWTLKMISPMMGICLWNWLPDGNWIWFIVRQELTLKGYQTGTIFWFIVRWELTLKGYQTKTVFLFNCQTGTDLFIFIFKRTTRRELVKKIKFLDGNWPLFFLKWASRRKLVKNIKVSDEICL